MFAMSFLVEDQSRFRSVFEIENTSLGSVLNSETKVGVPYHLITLIRLPFAIGVQQYLLAGELCLHNLLEAICFQRQRRLSFVRQFDNALSYGFAS
jgi:hypothetical protein